MFTSYNNSKSFVWLTQKRIVCFNLIIMIRITEITDFIWGTCKTVFQLNYLSVFTDWDRNLSLLNRQFFSKLAITMRTQQKLVLYEAYRKLQHMYKDITTIFKERKGNYRVLLLFYCL